MQSNGQDGIWARGSQHSVDGQSESEAESSYHGWSDQGPPASGSRQARPSLSSSEDHPPSDLPSASSFPPRGISFTSSQISQRRQTLPRPFLHSGGSNMSLDTLTPQPHHPPTAILNIGDVAAPATISPASFANPPSYPEATSTSTYTAQYTRARRRSLGQMGQPQSMPVESETSPDEGYHCNGVVPYGKGKKKKPRTSSLSLPFHRKRRTSNAKWQGWLGWILANGPRRSPRTLRQWGMTALILFTLLLVIVQFRRHYEIQVEFAVFDRRWIRHEIDRIEPLRGCFDPAHISPQYEIDQHNAPKQHLFSPGISLRRGTSCYDYAATIQPNSSQPLEPLVYHTYWRADLMPFGERQTATLLAFLATQPLSHSRLVLWTNGADVLSGNTFLKPFLNKWGDHIEVRQVDMKAFTKGTELEGVLSGIGGGFFDERGWIDGDAVRLLALWHFGGVWVDMDQVLTRDVHALTEQEFVTQWDCYDKPYFVLNGALMHFRQHSPYLCEAFHIMASSPFPRPNTFTWGSHLYSKLHRRLLANHQKPFAVLPWCFADPRNCRSDVRFPDPFKDDPAYWGGRRWDGKGEVGKSGREVLEEKVGGIWSIHLHNQWKKGFPAGGWIVRLLEAYKRRLREYEGVERTKVVEPEHAQQDTAAGDPLI